MKKQIFDFANEAAAVNARLAGNSIELSAKSAQEFMRHASKQTSDLLKVKTFDEYVKVRKSWDAAALNSSRNAVMAAVELGHSACDAYLSLWNKYAPADAVVMLPEEAAAKPKKNG